MRVRLGTSLVAGALTETDLCLGAEGEPMVSASDSDASRFSDKPHASARCCHSSIGVSASSLASAFRARLSARFLLSSLVQMSVSLSRRRLEAESEVDRQTVRPMGIRMRQRRIGKSHMA